MSRFKVGVFVGSFQPTDGGGFNFQEGIVDFLLNQRPLASDIEFHFLFNGSFLPDRWRETRKFTLIVAEGELPKKGGLLNEISRAFQGEKPDVIRPEGVKTLGFSLIWNLTPIYMDFGVPMVSTVWDLQHRRYPYLPEVIDQSTGWGWEARERHFQYMFQRSAAVIVPNSAGAREAMDYYGIDPANLILAHHPTSDFAMKQPLNPLKDYSPQESYIIYPAQFWPHKNHVLILLALKELERRGQFLKCVMTGSDQGNLGYIKNLAQKFGLTKQLEFTGFVSQEKLVSLIGHSFGLVYPSLFGPENLPPLEAMAMGTPVAVADVPGAREQFGDCAHYFPPLDESQLAKILSQWIEDPEVRKMRVPNAIQLAHSRTLEAYTAEVLTALMKLKKQTRTWMGAL